MATSAERNVSIGAPQSAREGPRQIEANSSSSSRKSSRDSSTAPASASPSSMESLPLTSTTTLEKISDRTSSGVVGTLAELKNYIAVGSLRLQVHPENPEPAGSCWLEVSGSWLDWVSLQHEKISTSLRTLTSAKWVRLFYHSQGDSPEDVVVQVYVLPDDVGRKYLDRSSRVARAALKHIMSVVNTSVESFEGRYDPGNAKNITQRLDHESLFYVFNTLDSPLPDPTKVVDIDSRQAVIDVLEGTGTLQGLKTPLYPYQRRSAAMMIQREANPSLMLDPRYETLTGPTGQQYYYDHETGNVIREKILYEEARGGILAETMGYGKTLICLAVILATKGHWPHIPAQYSAVVSTRPHTGSLMEMAAAKIGMSSIPWRPYFDQSGRLGEHYTKCIDACEANVGSYIIPPPEPRYKGRESKQATGKPVRLCMATLVIVPTNLIIQWRQEISRHTEDLKVLQIDKTGDEIPSAEELSKYDIVLLSKPRFEKESRGWEMLVERRHQPDSVYRSPLMDLHWLRIIVDEGHSFALSGTRTNAVHVLDQLQVERRWVVSGTPSNGLIGVEVGFAANETLYDTPSSPEVNSRLTLQARKNGGYWKEEVKDLEKLRVITQDFLKLQPWANSLADDSASWSKYIMPFDKNGTRRKSTTSLRSTLNGLVVRHRIEDVEKDLTLPPLHNRVVRLKPSFFDKLSINLFIMVLVSNAVTSERTGQDYLFHPKNRKELNLGVNNMRQSGFWWVGFDSKDLGETIRISRSFLEKNRGTTLESDRELLEEAIRFGEAAVQHPSWQALTQFHEIGIFVDDFPEFAREAWAMSPDQTSPLLMGTLEAKLAQKKVNSQLASHTDPTEGLAGAGLRAMQEAKKASDREKTDPTLENGAAEAGTAEEHNSNSIIKVRPANKSSPLKSRGSLTPLKMEGSGVNVLVSPITGTGASKLVIPPDSEAAKTKICGTTSAKLTYLIDRVLQYHEQEKIIIFYEGNNVAFWIAEALELLGIQFLIYANTLSSARRAVYLATFNQTETFRVLIMDLRQAAHGLHIACASRVFIVNPIWQPQVEAQAIKRAHRIGQTKPVYVETLVLGNTLEDKMLQRRKIMTNQELQHAEKSLLDDNTMSSIIQSERLIPISEEEMTGYGQIAMLETPQPLFGYGGRGTHAYNPDANLVLPESTPTTPITRAKRAVDFADDLSSIPMLESDLVVSGAAKRRKRSPIRLKLPCTPSGSNDDDAIIMIQPRRKSSTRPVKKDKRQDRGKGVSFAPGPDNGSAPMESLTHISGPAEQPSPALEPPASPAMRVAHPLYDSIGEDGDAPMCHAAHPSPYFDNTELNAHHVFSTAAASGPSLFGGSPSSSRGAARFGPFGVDSGSLAFIPFRDGNTSPSTLRLAGDARD